MLRRAVFPAAVLLLGLFALVPAAGAARANGVCDRLSKAEIEKAIGEPLDSAKGGVTATGAPFCNWLGKDDKLRHKGVVLILASDHVLARYRSNIALVPFRRNLLGIGTEAVTDGVAIFAHNGRAMLQIQQYYEGGGVPLSALQPLARLALERAR
jgi:hypothetical protein